MARPYQPSLLRLLHGLTALLVGAAWLSGLVVYSRYDGRWLGLPLRPGGDWIDLHGTVGVLLWPVALLFALYALSLGRSRLRRPGNGMALAALGLAVVSGKLMNEDWLRQSQLNHLVYGLHLLGWLGISVAVLWHLAGVWRLGGMALAGSMLSLSRRAGDGPRHWPGQIRRFLAGSAEARGRG